LGVDSLWQSTKSKKKKTKKLTQIRKWRENEPQKEKTNQPMRCDLSNLVAIITLHPLCNNITSDFLGLNVTSAGEKLILKQIRFFHFPPQQMF
jgi:hypothetical protein